MNDPNGLVYYKGKYHLFYQYNPYGINWGNMSWGHAISTNLVNWEEQPVAIPKKDGLSIYSGSTVIDWDNTSGFGKDGKPPMIAIYTGAGADNIQDQRLAYSNDEGITWTQYEQNPVLTMRNKEFRDPKVFWHKESKKWVMIISLGSYRRLRIYNSPNLKNWTLLQDFGGTGNQCHFWECPDLFELPVNADTTNKKWVMMHSVGSYSQYFIGDFDGQHFNWQTEMPQGILIADFENTVTNNWTAIGEAFGRDPVNGITPNPQVISGYLGQKILTSYSNQSTQTGKIISTEFTIQKKYISFLISGGNYPTGTYIKLVVNGETVKSSTGQNENYMRWKNWDVSAWDGQPAHIEIVDSVNASWGHISIDHILQTDEKVELKNTGVIDLGKDFYAAQSFSDIPASDGRRIWMAWLGNWSYTYAIPTTPWKGMMSLPREVKLVNDGNGIKLVQQPVKELEALRKNELKFTKTKLSNINKSFLTGISSVLNNPVYKQFEIKARIKAVNSKGFSIRFKKHGLEYTEIIFDFVNKEIRFDRSRSGALVFDTYYRSVQPAPLETRDGYFDFHLFVDNSSAELFAGEGKTVLTNQLFPDSISNKLELIAIDEDPEFEEFTIWRLGKPGPLPGPSIDNKTLFEFFPNPVVNSNGLTIKIKDEYIGKLNFRLYSPDGKLIYEFQPTTYSIIIPRNKMAQAKGLYVLTATDGINTQSEKLTVMGY